MVHFKHGGILWGGILRNWLFQIQGTLMGSFLGRLGPASMDAFGPISQDAGAPEGSARGLTCSVSALLSSCPAGLSGVWNEVKGRKGVNLS